MHNMPNDNMQNNMQINMQNMLAICRFGSDCLVLTVICRICQIICLICSICYDDFQYAQYALPTLLMHPPEEPQRSPHVVLRAALALQSCSTNPTKEIQIL